MSTRVFVRVYDGKKHQESEECIVLLPERPLTWTGVIQTMLNTLIQHQNLPIYDDDAHGDDFPAAALIKRTRLFLLPTEALGIVAEMNARSLRFGLRENDKLAICLNGENYRSPQQPAPLMAATSNLHGSPAGGVTTTSTTTTTNNNNNNNNSALGFTFAASMTNASIQKPPLSVSSHSVVAQGQHVPGHVNAVTASEQQQARGMAPSGSIPMVHQSSATTAATRKSNKRFRSISGKMAAIKSLGDLGLISVQDRGHLKDLLLHDDNPELQDALDRFNDTGDFQSVQQLLMQEMQTPSTKRNVGDWLADSLLNDLALHFTASDQDGVKPLSDPTATEPGSFDFASLASLESPSPQPDLASTMATSQAMQHSHPQPQPQPQPQQQQSPQQQSQQHLVDPDIGSAAALVPVPAPATSTSFSPSRSPYLMHHTTARQEIQAKPQYHLQRQQHQQQHRQQHRQHQPPVSMPVWSTSEEYRAYQQQQQARQGRTAMYVGTSTYGSTPQAAAYQTTPMYPTQMNPMTGTAPYGMVLPTANYGTSSSSSSSSSNANPMLHYGARQQIATHPHPHQIQTSSQRYGMHHPYGGVHYDGPVHPNLVHGYAGYNATMPYSYGGGSTTSQLHHLDAPASAAQMAGYGGYMATQLQLLAGLGGLSTSNKWNTMLSYPPACSKAEKQEKIAKWLKKREHRNWSNKPSYPARHSIAKNRKRGEDGRFIPKAKLAEMAAAAEEEAAAAAAGARAAIAGGAAGGIEPDVRESRT